MTRPSLDFAGAWPVPNADGTFSYRLIWDLDDQMAERWIRDNVPTAQPTYMTVNDRVVGRMTWLNKDEYLDAFETYRREV